MSQSVCRPRSARPGRISSARKLGLTALSALAVVLLGCNYTGDMNVQDIKSAYNVAARPQPIADARDRQSQGRVPSVPVNPTPENYWGNPYRAFQPSPVPAGYPAAAAHGTGQHPYVGVDVPVIDGTHPTPNSPAAVARGQVLYQNTCLSCHGATAKGNGIVGAWFQRTLNKPPADLTSAAIQANPDSHFYDVMTNGFGAMPALSYELQPEERWDLVYFVRTLRTQ